MPLLRTAFELLCFFAMESIDRRQRVSGLEDSGRLSFDTSLFTEKSFIHILSLSTDLSEPMTFRTDPDCPSTNSPTGTVNRRAAGSSV